MLKLRKTVEVQAAFDPEEVLELIQSAVEQDELPRKDVARVAFALLATISQRGLNSETRHYVLAQLDFLRECLFDEPIAGPLLQPKSP